MGIIRVVGAAVLALSFVASAQAGRLSDQPLVDTGWLSKTLGNESLVVVDIRAPSKKIDFYAKNHIPGAVNAPYGKFGWRSKENGIVGQLPKVETITARIASLGIENDDHVVIVPFGKNSSDFGSATRVYWTFKVLGHDNVSILDGGMEAWVATKGEQSSVAVTPKASSFTSTLRPELIADAAEVAAAKSNGVALVDARPEAQYSGKKKSPVARVAGTIPGAVSISQARFYDDKKMSFVNRDTIAALSTAAGVAHHAEEITFCNTGHWASVAWFGLSEVLGNKNTKMYDGSMADWTSDKSRPVQ